MFTVVVGWVTEKHRLQYSTPTFNGLRPAGAGQTQGSCSPGVSPDTHYRRPRHQQTHLVYWSFDRFYTFKTHTHPHRKMERQMNALADHLAVFTCIEGLNTAESWILLKGSNLPMSYPPWRREPWETKAGSFKGVEDITEWYIYNVKSYHHDLRGLMRFITNLDDIKFDLTWRIKDKKISTRGGFAFAWVSVGKKTEQWRTGRDRIDTRD